MVDNERQAAVPALEVVNVKFPEITTLQVNHALLLDLLNVDVVKIIYAATVCFKEEPRRKEGRVDNQSTPAPSLLPSV